MSRKQIVQRMKPILLRRQEALRRSLAGELGQFNTSDERAHGDEADLATDTDYGVVNSLLAETESHELERIDHALELIREGRYGVCESCSKNIPMARLQALPYATTCIHCQRAEERGGFGQRSGGDRSRLPADFDADNYSRTADMSSLY